MNAVRPTAGEVRAVLAGVSDPEIPVLTIDDLGILRDVTQDDQGRVHVQITPTYSGCPAMETIRTDLVEAAILLHVGDEHPKLGAPVTLQHLQPQSVAWPEQALLNNGSMLTGTRMTGPS